MRTFKVIALSCSGKGKRIYSSGDVVDESGFPEGTIEELIAGNFIIQIQKNEIELPEKTEAKKVEKKAKKEVN